MAASGTTTYSSFFTAMLQKLGIMPTPGALKALADVSHEEGLNTYFNPLNITAHSGSNPATKGVTTFNTVGVQEYANPQAGIDATSTFLSTPRYAGVRSALATGNENVILSAIRATHAWSGDPLTPTTSNTSILATPLGGKPLPSKPSASGAATAFLNFLKGGTTAPASWNTKAPTNQSIGGGYTLTVFPSQHGLPGQATVQWGKKTPFETATYTIAPDGTLTPTKTSDAGTVIADPLLGIPDAVKSTVNAATSWLSFIDNPAAWKRIGLGAVGAAMLIVGLVMIMKNEVKLPGVKL